MTELNGMLADPIEGLDLPDGAIVTSMLVIVEYIEPDAVDSPNRTRLGYDASDGLSAWETMGMLRFAEQLEFHAVGRA